MLYTRVNSNELPFIKPETLYIITPDGTVYLQGYGVIAKYNNGDEAEIAFNDPETFNKCLTVAANLRIYNEDFK